MAAIAAIVSAVLRMAWRTLRETSSFTGNNIVALIALLMAAEPANRPSSTAVLYLAIGLLWVLPSSQELTRRIPSIRFRLWPLNPWQKVSVYGLNLLFNPLIAIAILFGLLSRDRLVGVGIASIAAVAPFAVLAGNTVSGRFSTPSPMRLIPRLPGLLGGLVQSQLRSLLQLLDVYLAVSAAIGGVIYTHFSAKPDPAASIVLGSFVVVLMTTCAQGHVSFDGQASETRMRLLPMSGVSVLFARDAAWLLVVIPLVIAFHPMAAVASALAALLIGHRTSAKQPIEQKRWNFATGRLAPQGIVQLIAVAGAASAVQQWGWPALAVIVALYSLSLWWSGRQWDQHP